MTVGPPLRLGTRGSALARRQTALVAERLATLGRPVELVPIVTAGDRRPPNTAWGEGAFVGALRDALLAGRIDLAVHSAKDVPLDGPPGVVVAYLDRRDPRDALVLARAGDAGPAGPGRRRTPADPLELLPRGARVGTDSPRRSGFLRAARPDLVVVPLHGNVDTRLRRLDAGEVDALVLAAAGLLRLGLGGRIDALLPLELLPPAPGQGALAVEALGEPMGAEGSPAVEALGALDEAAVRLAVSVERSVLARLGGGCRAPVGVVARLLAAGESPLLEVLGGVVDPDGGHRRIVVRRGPTSAATDLAREVAEALAAAPGRRGASRRPGALRRRGRRMGEGEAVRADGDRPGPVPDLGVGSPAVLVTADPAARGGLVRALRRRGWRVRAVPTVRLVPVRPGTEAAEALDAALRLAPTAERLVVTSPRGARLVVRRLVDLGIDPAALRWAAVGDATARPLRTAGARDVLVPGRADGASLAAALLDDLAHRQSRDPTVVLARASAAAADLPSLLRAAGVRVVEAVAYETREGPDPARAPLALALADPYLAAVVFASGSAIRGLRRLASPAAFERARRLPTVVIGPRTADVARAEGFERIVVAAEPASAALARAVAAVLSPAAS